MVGLGDDGQGNSFPTGSFPKIHLSSHPIIRFICDLIHPAGLANLLA
jgi:hypothetical protein